MAPVEGFMFNPAGSAGIIENEIGVLPTTDDTLLLLAATFKHKFMVLVI